MLRSLLVMSLLMLPAGAAAQTRVDFDKHQDFLQYRTFDVAIGPLVRADGTVDEQNTLNEDRLRRAIASELSARGLESTSVGADLEVRVSGRDTERTEVISSGFNHFPTYSIGRSGCETGVSRTSALTATGVTRSTTMCGRGGTSKVR